MCGFPGAQAVVEHHPRAAERPGQGLTLARRRVEAVVIPELHPLSILGFMAGYGGIRTGRHCFLILHAHLVFVTRYRHAVFAAALLAGEPAVVGVVLRRVRRRGAYLRPAPVHRAAGPPVLTGSCPSAFTTGLKAGALADIPVAAI